MASENHLSPLILYTLGYGATSNTGRSNSPAVRAQSDRRILQNLVALWKIIIPILSAFSMMKQFS